MRIVFRADTRDPAAIYASGFQPRFEGGIKITEGGQMTGGVSTSKDLGVSLRYAAAYDGWLYVCLMTEGVDVLDHLSKKGHKKGIPNAISQMEIAAKSIPGANVIGARRARQSGGMAEMYGEVDVNEGCTVSEAEKSLAIGFLRSNATVSKEYKH